MINAQTRLALAFTAGICVGGGIGYLIADHHLKKLAAEDLAAVQDMFKRLRDEDKAEPESVDEAQAEPAEENDYQTPQHGIAAEEVIRLGYRTRDDVERTVIIDPSYVSPDTNPNDLDVEELEFETEPDLEKEVDYVNGITRNYAYGNEADPDDVTTWDRSPDRPYVITEAEFRIDRPEFEKDSLIYYAGDDKLAEENGNFIPDKNGTAGNENLRRFFGYGSGDERLLYIRNERVLSDFEITLHDGKYDIEVLGLDDDVDIPPKRIIKKMRHGE